MRRILSLLVLSIYVLLGVALFCLDAASFRASSSFSPRAFAYALFGLLLLVAVRSYWRTATFRRGSTTRRLAWIFVQFAATVIAIVAWGFVVVALLPNNWFGAGVMLAGMFALIALALYFFNLAITELRGR